MNDTRVFKKTVWNFYKKNKREFPWRTNCDPYWVLISEIMLQQTQVSRALIKFPEFIESFPTLTSLACATTTQILNAWQGLGYNRRALYLKQIAKIICTQHDGCIPKDSAKLNQFPGIGPNTAGSIIAFAYNIPIPFIETNIRTVFLHHFFHGKKNISDAMLMPLITKTLDKKNPREWYWALMDYGSYLKKQFKNPSRGSRHHIKQKKFEGSLRQIRGLIIKIILKNGALDAKKIAADINRPIPEIQCALDGLLTENFLVLKRNRYFLLN